MKRKFAILDKEQVFYCDQCNCLFQADDHDFELEKETNGSVYAVTTCLNCKCIVEKLRYWRLYEDSKEY